MHQDPQELMYWCIYRQKYNINVHNLDSLKKLIFERGICLPERRSEAIFPWNEYEPANSATIVPTRPPPTS